MDQKSSRNLTPIKDEFNNFKSIQNNKINSEIIPITNILDQEYLDGIKNIENLISKIKCENKTYLFFSKFEDNQLKLTIYEIEKIWIKIFSKSDFIEFKKKMGFEGNWFCFFKTFELAINKKSGGDLSIKYNSNKKENLIVSLYHPITDDLKVKSEIIFENYIKADDRDFQKLSFNLCFESINSFEKKMEDKNNFSTENNKNLDDRDKIEKGSKISARLDFKKNQKRKFASDLINPNIKKRKGKGNKFMNNSSSGEEN